MGTRALALLLAPLLCIWDSDTLDDELLGLPEAEALVVTGRWVRHGRPYYERRVRDVEPRLSADPKHLDLYDDLAVAHARLGDPARALEVMARKEKVLATHADEGHRYRLLANRGMFEAQAGLLDEAVADLEKAVAMNPGSHFGREKYQIDLFRYLAEARKDPAVFDKGNFLFRAGHDPDGGWRGLVESTVPPPYDEKLQKVDLGGAKERRQVPWKELYTAVAGMFRAGSTGEAELYRTLGDLFLAHGGRMDGDLHLAWWSYRRAHRAGHPSKSAIESALGRIERHWREGKVHRVPTMDSYTEMMASEARWLAALHDAEVRVPEGTPIAMESEPEGAPAEKTKAVVPAPIREADRVAGPPPAAAPLQPMAYIRNADAGLLFLVAGGALLTALLVWLVRRSHAAPRGA